MTKLRKATLPSAAGPKRSESDRRLRRQADRIGRLLRVLQLLLGRGRWNARDIATEQECAERTVYRDLEVLQLAGVPVEFDGEDKCYRLRQDFRFPVLNLTEEEAIGQATATALSKTPGIGVDVGAASVTRKLTASAKSGSDKILEDASKLIAVLDLKLADHSAHKEVIRTVQEALLRHRQLSGIYRSPYEPKDVKLQLHPYRLCLVKQAWYVIARQESRELPRTFRVARFKSLRMTETSSQIPQGFDLKAYFGDAWAVYRGEISYEVEILFTKESAATVTEGIWHHTQRTRKNKDGSVSFTFRVDGLNEIVRWILGWGCGAKVIKPAELKALVVDQFRAGLNLYSDETEPE